MLGIILVILLIVILLGGVGGPYIHPGLPLGYGAGYPGIGILVILLIVIVVLLLLGRI